MKQYLTFTFYILLFALLTACGSNPNSSQNSGALTFNIKLSRPATAYQTAYLTGNDICIDYGVETVTAVVKDSSGKTITSGNWSCSAHQGTITGIPSGNNYTVKLEGKDSDSTVTWSGEKTGISISRGETTAAGTIAMTYTGTDKTAPEISSTSPSDGVVNVPVTSLLTATFSEKMAISSVNDKTFKLTNGTTPVSGSVTYDSTTKKAIFIPATNLTYSATYTATVTTGVEDMAGNNMQTDHTWIFTTEASPTSAPSAPTGVTATAGNGQATITWDAITGATSYNIYWSTTSGVTINPDTDIIGVTSPYIHTGRNNGTTYYYVVTAANDIYGESDTSVEVSVTPVATDTTPPTGSVIINNNATYTNSTTVTLTLSATDSSGISQMCISNENTCPSSSWETYTTSKSWVLTAGDGIKTVYAWFKDGAGNANETHNTDSITLDTTAPEISSTSPSDSAVNVPVTSLLTATFSEKMAISSVNSITFKLTNGTTPVSGSVTYDSNTKKAIFIPATNLSYSTTYTATITTGIEDMAGNNMQADKTWGFTTEDSPTTAPSAPTGVTATAGNGQTTITWDAVTGATSYNIYWSTTLGVTINPDTDIIGVTSPYIHTGRNNETTYYYVVTAVNVHGESDTSAEVSVIPVATDTTPPTGSVIINNNATYTNSTTVTLTLSATDSSGISQMCISSETTCSTSSWETYTTSKSWTLTAGDGIKTVYAWFKDAAGNLSSSSYADSITLDSTAPSNTTGSNFINSGALSTISSAVSLTISATDNVGVVGYYASDSSNTPSSNAAGWTSVTPTTSYLAGVTFTLSSGDGTKTVYVWFKDAAGNLSNMISDSIIFGSPPSPPTGVTATAGAGQVTISWNAVSGATSYNIYWSTTSGITKSTGTKIPDLTAIPYAHTGRTFGTTYYYVVTAVNGYGESGESGQVSAIPPVLMGGGVIGLLNLSGHVSTLAGSGDIGSIDGIGTSASFYYPYGITTDGTNLYLADKFNNKIRKVVIATREVTTIAGSGSTGSQDGLGNSASFNYPTAITTDGFNLYVADTDNNQIRKVVIATGEVTTIAGSGTAGSVDGRGIAASFNVPRAITTDGTNLYVGDAYGNMIRKVVIATGDVSTIAGSGSPGFADGTASMASFNGPHGITTDGINIYISDRANHAIRQVVIATGVVTTLAGSGISGSTDGLGTAASFNYPQGITTDGANLYVADLENNKIRKIVIKTGAVTTTAGSGSMGSSDGIGTNASFYGPTGITTDGIHLYVTDHWNHRIRKIAGIGPGGS